MSGKSKTQSRGSSWALAIAAAAVVAVSAGGAAAGVESRQAAPLTKITIVYTSPASAFLPWKVAKDAGIFEKHGLDVNLFLAIGPASNAAVISGSAQISLDGATPVATAIGRGAPLALVGAFINRLALVGVGEKSIRRPADLRGKKIATNAPGSIGDVATRLMLRDAGLDPNRDVQIQYIPALNDRTAALLAGRIDAVITSPPIRVLRETGRFEQFFDFRGYRQILSGISAQRRWATENPGTLAKVFRSYVDAAQYIHNKANRTQVLKSLSELTLITNPLDLDEGLAYALPFIQDEPVFDPVSIRNSVEVARDTQNVSVTVNDVIYAKPLEDALRYTVRGELTTRDQVPRPRGARTAARGLVTGVLSANGTYRWQLTFSGLTGQATYAAIHVGLPGRIGPARVRLCAPCRSGQTGTARIGSKLAQAMKFTRHGRTYAAIATRANPRGEVRGTLNARFR